MNPQAKSVAHPQRVYGLSTSGHPSRFIYASKRRTLISTGNQIASELKNCWCDVVDLLRPGKVENLS